MKKYLFKLLIILMLPISIYAGDAQMKETLTQIIDGIEALKVLVNKAEAEQDKNPRVKVHFSRFKDETGKSHNGLRDDLNEIQKSLIDVVDNNPRTPRKIVALEHDFIGKNYEF